MKKALPPPLFSFSTVLLVAMIALFIAMLNLDLLRNGELELYDFRNSLLPALEPSGRIVVADLDDESFERYGPWPWNRTTIAQLALNLAAQKPLAVGWNLIFIDRYSDLRSIGSQDAVLRDTFEMISKKCPQILGYYLNFRGQPSENLPLVKPALYGIISEGPMPDPTPLLKAGGASGVIPEFAAAASSQAFCAGQIDTDGYVRSAPLAFEFNNKFMIPLAPAVLNTERRETYLRFDAGGVTGVKIGQDWVQPNYDGYLLLRFPPVIADIPHIPAWKIIEGKTSGLDISGKIIFVGSSASNVPLYPTSSGEKLSSVEIEAVTAENLLARTAPVYRPDWAPGLEIVCIFTMSLLSIIMAFRMTHRTRFYIFLILLSGYGLFNSIYLFMVKHWVINLILPAAVIAVNYVVLSLATIYTKKHAR